MEKVKTFAGHLFKIPNHAGNFGLLIKISNLVTNAGIGVV
jgi:hypothetical protein